MEQSFSSLLHDYYAATDRKDEANAIEMIAKAIFFVADSVRHGVSTAKNGDTYINHHSRDIVERKRSGFVPTGITGKRPVSIAMQRRLAFKAMSDKLVATVSGVSIEQCPVSDIANKSNKLLAKNTQATVIQAMPGIEVDRNGFAMFTPNRHKNTLRRMTNSSDILAQRSDEKTKVLHHYQNNHGVALAEQLSKLKVHHNKLIAQSMAASAKGLFERASKLDKQIAVNTAKMQEYAVKVAALLTK